MIPQTGPFLDGVHSRREALEQISSSGGGRGIGDFWTPELTPALSGSWREAVPEGAVGYSLGPCSLPPSPSQGPRGRNGEATGYHTYGSEERKSRAR